MFDMRRLFIFVLLLNFAYITWQLVQTPDDGHVRKVSNNHIPSLILISELEQTELEQTELEHSMEQPEELVAGEAVIEMAAVEKDKVSEKRAVAKKPEKKKMLAVKESKKTKLADKTLIEKGKRTTLSVLKSEPPADACYTLGPFRKLNKLRVFTRLLKDYVVDVSFRSREEHDIYMFWVYLAPANDPKTTHKLSKRLISKKIRDYYIITSGQKRNGISLGHFKDKKRASSHAKRLKKLGFNPIIEPIYSTYLIYWLDYRIKQGLQIPDKIFDRHMSARMNKLNRECI